MCDEIINALIDLNFPGSEYADQKDNRIVCQKRVKQVINRKGQAKACPTIGRDHETKRPTWI